MTQKFPNLTGNSYIDTGILELQDRDDTVLTLSAGYTAPSNPFQDLIWNDLTNKCLKWYNNNDWEIIIDYSKSYISEVLLGSTYQPLNSTLTNYSNGNVTGIGLLDTDGTFVPMSQFFIDKMCLDFKGNLGLGKLAYKDKLTSSDIDNNSIPLSKVNGNITTTPVFRLGDTIPSFNSGTKAGCVKLSKSSATIFTVGATSSSSTYKGDVYKNLFQFLWNNYSSLGLKIYNSGGVKTSKGSSWSADWNANKRLELPHIDLPNANAPKDSSVNSSAGKTGSSGNITISKSGYYEITLVGGGGGSAGNSAGSAGHQSGCTGASGAGFKGTILLNKNDVINYTVGSGGEPGKGWTDWGSPNISEATAGGDSFIKVNGTKLVTCGGGGGGKTVSGKGNRGAGYRGYEPNGGTVTVHVSGRFTNTTRQSGPNGVGSSNDLEKSINGVFNNNYGKGAPVQVFSNNSMPKLYQGFAGYLYIKYLSPKEYETTDSGVITTLDNMYAGLTYFMKY